MFMNSDRSIELVLVLYYGSILNIYSGVFEF